MMKNDIYKKILIIGLGVLFCLTTIQANQELGIQSLLVKSPINNTKKTTTSKTKKSKS